MIDLITDSRKIKPGDTFIALRGVDRDGHDYIESAIQNGATKIVCEEGEYSVETIIVPDTRKYFEEYLEKNYYPLIKDMKLIGVTGTNGKTTTCFLVHQILNLLGFKTAYIGTIGFYIGDKIRELNNTTPDLDVLYNMFLESKDKGAKCIIMEVSSHALAMNRVHGLLFDEVAFTNLTQDHLDYHKTFDNYVDAKKLLFNKLRNDKISIINKDDSYAHHFMIDGNNNIGISDTNGDVVISNMTFTNTGTLFSFKYLDKVYDTTIKMVGRYNIYNYLTALMLVHKLGYRIEDILKLNDKLSNPRGRMEMITYGTNSIFVDYAHTPDAVSNVLNTSLEYKEGKIITIIGCGGNRDRTKRPIMGKIATELSDYVIFTNDNPRDEDEKIIMDDIIEGVSKNNYEIIFDRKDAIHKGMSMLKNKDILMILGKGHEDYQIIRGEKHHFDDKECVLNYIENKK